MKDLSQLPDDLPVPVDDGACDHLEGLPLPSLLIKTSTDHSVDLSKIKSTVVIFFYPMIGNPDSPPMPDWNEIPGARGCTPQACSYRDNYDQLFELGVTVYGASSQSIVEQQESSDRLALPFELLNDSEFKLVETLKLPTFKYLDQKRIKRLILVIINGVIQKVFYPVFPPDQNVDLVIDWLNEQVI